MTTKRDLINGAFEELGMGAYNYDLQPEDYDTALSRLDGMMAEWGSYGAPVAYPLTSDSQTSTIDDVVQTPLPLIEGIKASLAIRLAPGYGKTPSPDTKSAAARGWNVAMRLASTPPEKRINNAAAPAGAGYKLRQGNRALAQDGPYEITPEGKIKP